ncbi:MAG TPA: hypothetical protein VGL94_07395 [Ktedonobacteraceae bacterium]|jgi:hypothetical protein
MATDELKAVFKLAQERTEKLSLKSQDIIVKKILRDIEEAEWDETLMSPESLAYQERVRAKIEDDIATGNIKNYFTDEDLEKLF